MESPPNQKKLLQMFNAEVCEGDERTAAVVAATDVGSPSNSKVRMKAQLMYGAFIWTP